MEIVSLTLQLQRLDKKSEAWTKPEKGSGSEKDINLVEKLFHGPKLLASQVAMKIQDQVSNFSIPADIQDCSKTELANMWDDTQGGKIECFVRNFIQPFLMANPQISLKRNNMASQPSSSQETHPQKMCATSSALYTSRLYSTASPIAGGIKSNH